MKLLNGGSLTAGTKKGEMAATTTGLLLVGLGKAGVAATARKHSREHLDALSSFARLFAGGKVSLRSFAPDANPVIM